MDDKLATTYLTKQQQLKILKEAHSGGYKLLQTIKTNNPQFHWSELKYEQTGDTILHCFACLGQLEAIKFLLTQFQPSGVNCKNKDNKTALHEAVQFGQYDTVKLLIEFGAEINVLKRADWTPLMLACTKITDTIINYKIVKELLENGAIVNYRNKDGWTVLHLISREGSVEILNLLIEHNLDLNITTNNGRTALHIACFHGHLDYVKHLLNLDSFKSKLNSKDSCGNSSLHEAVLSRNIEICRLLITFGADKNCRNTLGFSLLHLAASQGFCEMVLFILNELKFYVNLKTVDMGFTCLHLAAKCNQKQVYDMLCDLGADDKVKDNFGRVPSDYFQ